MTLDYTVIFHGQQYYLVLVRRPLWRHLLRCVSVRTAYRADRTILTVPIEIGHALILAPDLVDACGVPYAG